MPLDGHSYLVAQGWSGEGTGLRRGAISKPLAIPQKKTLAGLGRDRDEAFPFWDHLFTAAASTIKIKVTSDDEDSDDSGLASAMTIKRTSTGILSTRRPVSGTAANSGTTIPDSDTPGPRLNLLANAKREVAKRGLYSRFFRGPVLGLHDRDASNDCQGGSGCTTSGAVPVEEAQVGQTIKRKSAEVTEARKKKRQRKSELDGVDKKETKEEDRKKGNLSVRQLEISEEAKAKKVRKRDKRAGQTQEDTCSDREESGKKRRDKRKREKIKNETTAVETLSAPGDNSLTYLVERNLVEERGDMSSQHNIVTAVNVTRKKKRKRTETF